MEKVNNKNIKDVFNNKELNNQIISCPQFKKIVEFELSSESRGVGVL